MRVRELAEWLGATFEGDGEREVDAAAPLESAGGREITFAGVRKTIREASVSAAACLVVPLEFDNTAGRTVIRAADPRAAFARIVRRLHPQKRPAPGVHPTAIIAADAVIGAGITVEPYAVIGAGAIIGDGAWIGAHCAIGERVTIGPGSRLHPRVTIYNDVDIGARALIHSGAVIGADGFGFVLEGGRYEKFPQVGRVVIGDDVEIGANTTIDRAALGVTAIEDGVKLDNLIHVGHNCRIGRHVVIAAQTGMAGGTVIEEYAVVGGQVGIGDNATIRARAIIGSGAGILSSKVVRGGGEVYWGTPARPLKEYLEGLASVTKIPKLKQAVEDLSRRLEKVEQRS